MAIHRWGIFPAVTAAGLLSLAGCTSPAHTPEEKYVLVATNIKLSYWQTALAGLNGITSEYKVKAELAGPDTYDVQAQKQEFRRILAQKPSGILVSAADPNLMAPEIDAALSQGIPVITVDSDAPASKRLMFIGTDNYKAGQLSAQTAAKLLNGKGNVVVFTMAGQANLDQRLHGLKDIVDGHPQMKVTQVIDMKGDSTTAFDAAKQLIDSKAKADAFVCLEAVACPEVGEVINRAGMGGKVVVVAMDTDQRTLEWIKKGVVSATIGQKPYTMAYYGLKVLDDIHHHALNPLVADWAQNAFSPIPTFIDTGASLIDKDNVNAFMEQRQSNGAK